MKGFTSRRKMRFVNFCGTDFLLTGNVRQSAGRFVFSESRPVSEFKRTYLVEAARRKGAKKSPNGD